jgi:hypothetical protein
MKRRFVLVRTGKWRRSAARGMARAGFNAAVIAIVLRLKLSVARDIVACRAAPGALWNAAEQALFREMGR